MTTIKPFKNLRRVYCAGPLFNAAERREMHEIADALAAGGFDPFLPHADGLEFSQVLPELERRGWLHAAAGRLLHEAIFALDVYHVLAGCGSLVFNLNGRTPDEGGVAEMTMAWMVGKPVVIYKEDVRSAIAGRDNPLVIGQTEFTACEQLEQLTACLQRQIDSLACDADFEWPVPPRLARVLAAGEQFWQRFATLGVDRPAEPLADWIVELFATDENRVSLAHGGARRVPGTGVVSGQRPSI
ncbi:MAG: nucleoside 2-deoxyribosyltransferase [Pirellulales bacterium]